jgi:hypothetical protein
MDQGLLNTFIEKMRVNILYGGISEEAVLFCGNNYAG